MKRFAGLLVCAACGSSGPHGPLVYTNPTPTSGALELVKDRTATSKAMVLDLIVGKTAVTGYSTGFNLPIDTTKVTLGAFTPGGALSPGSLPMAAHAVLPTSGPLAGDLVIAQSQKAAGAGAVTTDTMLAPGTVLFTIELDYTADAPDGVVFDGTAPGFALPSGGLLDRTGNSVVAPADVAIGKLEVIGVK
ncbi:MAG TPA: hypothetical protein VGF94_27945 [Kofleriaceae bacterium]